MELSLSFSGADVVMQAQNLNTTESDVESYTTHAATHFVAAGHTNYPTSLLTEWYHVLPYLCVNSPTRFTTVGWNISQGWLHSDEWNLTGYPLDEWFNSDLRGQLLFHSPLEPFDLADAAELFYMDYSGVGMYVTHESFTTT